MEKYHRQQTELCKQDEEMDNAIKERATQLEKTAEVEEEDKQSAFVGCMTDHVTTAMEELVTAQSCRNSRKWKSKSILLKIVSKYCIIVLSIEEAGKEALRLRSYFSSMSTSKRAHYATLGVHRKLESVTS